MKGNNVHIQKYFALFRRFPFFVVYKLYISYRNIIYACSNVCVCTKVRTMRRQVSDVMVCVPCQRWGTRLYEYELLGAVRETYANGYTLKYALRDLAARWWFDQGPLLQLRVEFFTANNPANHLTKRLIVLDLIVNLA